MVHINEVFENNKELPDNPLYISSQHIDKLRYSSDQEKQLDLPPMDSKKRNKTNPNHDVSPYNKPINRAESSMPVYAVPNKSNVCTSEVGICDVYAQVCKPNGSTAQIPAQKRNKVGHLSMTNKQDTAATKQRNTSDKNEIMEGVCYAEIKRPYTIN